MFRVDFLCDVIDIAVGFKASDMSDVYFDDGHTRRDYFDFFKYAREENKAPYVYDYHTDGNDLIIEVRYEL